MTAWFEGRTTQIHEGMLAWGGLEREDTIQRQGNARLTKAGVSQSIRNEFCWQWPCGLYYSTIELKGIKSCTSQDSHPSLLTRVDLSSHALCIFSSTCYVLASVFFSYQAFFCPRAFPSTRLHAWSVHSVCCIKKLLEETLYLMTQFIGYLLEKTFSDLPVNFYHCIKFLSFTAFYNLYSCMAAHVCICFLVYFSLLSVSSTEISAVRTEIVSFPLTTIGCVIFSK